MYGFSLSREKWKNTFFELSKHSSHSIKYLRIKGGVKWLDLNFLSDCSNLEELYLSPVYLDKIDCLEDIHWPKLFSFSLLGCDSKDTSNKWITYIEEFLKNNKSTLKELKLGSSSETLCEENYMVSILNTISFYCINITLLGLNLDNIFGYFRHDYKMHDALKEFKSVCSNCSNLKKIILYTSYYRDYYYLTEELMLNFIHILPKSLRFLSFEGVIKIDSLKKILRNCIDNLINLSFCYSPYWPNIVLLERELKKIALIAGRRLNLTSNDFDSEGEKVIHFRRFTVF